MPPRKMTDMRSTKTWDAAVTALAELALDGVRDRWATQWVEVRCVATGIDGAEHAMTCLVPVDPSEPGCPDSDGHDWAPGRSEDREDGGDGVGFSTVNCTRCDIERATEWAYHSVTGERTHAWIAYTWPGQETP